MPQMAPMWWTTLFLFFVMCFMMIAVKSYFMIEYSPKIITSKKMNIKNNIWKW